MDKIYNIIVIGLGHQSLEDHIPALNQLSNVVLTGVVDINEEVAREVALLYSVEYGTSIEDLLEKIEKPSVALVALPHSEYLPIIRKLAEKGIHIIKEKPFALNTKEAEELFALSKTNKVSIQVTLQRRYNPIFKTFCQLVRRIGDVHSVEARYTLNIDNLGEGWRSKRSVAGGGALIDMGYHYIDLFIWYFGMPDRVSCRMSGHNRPGQDYDVEDTAFIDFTYQNDETKILSTLFISRVYHEKSEGFVAHGTKGSISLTRGRIIRYNPKGEIVEELYRTDAWPSAIIDQIESLLQNISSGEWEKNNEQYLHHTVVLDACYRSAEIGREIRMSEYFEKDYGEIGY